MIMQTSAQNKTIITYVVLFGIKVLHGSKVKHMLSDGNSDAVLRLVFKNDK